jgi:hypothetical protein
MRQRSGLPKCFQRKVSEIERDENLHARTMPYGSGRSSQFRREWPLPQEQIADEASSHANAGTTDAAGAPTDLGGVEFSIELQ